MLTGMGVQYDGYPDSRLLNLADLVQMILYCLPEWSRTEDSWDGEQGSSVMVEALHVLCLLKVSLVQGREVLVIYSAVCATHCGDCRCPVGHAEVRAGSVAFYSCLRKWGSRCPLLTMTVLTVQVNTFASCTPIDLLLPTISTADPSTVNGEWAT